MVRIGERVWPNKGNHQNGILFVYDREDDETINEEREVRLGDLYDQVFLIHDINREYMPERLGFWYNNTHIVTNKLRCSTRCQYNHLKECWCSCIKQLEYAAEAYKIIEATSSNSTTIFKIKVTVTKINLVGDFNISIKFIKNGIVNKINVFDPATIPTSTHVYNNSKPTSTKQVTYDGVIHNTSSYETASYHTLPSTSASTTTQVTPNTSEITFIGVDGKEENKYYFEGGLNLLNLNIKLDSNQLPNQIKISYYTSRYESDLISCRSKFGNGSCRSPVCWCLMINQLRTTGVSQIRIPLKNCSLRYDYWFVIFASVDKENNNIVKLKILLNYTCYHTLDNIPKNHEYFTQFSPTGANLGESSHRSISSYYEEYESYCFGTGNSDQSELRVQTLYNIKRSNRIINPIRRPKNCR